MLKELKIFTRQNRDGVHLLFRSYQAMNKNLILGSEIWDLFCGFCDENPQYLGLRGSPLADMLKKSQSAAIMEPWLYLDVRPNVAHWMRARVILLAEITGCFSQDAHPLTK